MSSINYKQLRVLIVDDHDLILNSLEQILINSIFNCKIFKAKNIVSMLEIMTKNPIDIVLLDLNLNGQNSMDYIGEIRNIRSTIKVIIITSYTSQNIISEAIELKVDGFLNKNTNGDEISFAIDQVLKNQVYIGTNDQKKMRFEHFSDQFLQIKILTNREKDVLKLLAKGFTNSKIAKELYISIHTVQSHRKNMLRKLDLHSVNELIAFAYENRIV